MGNCSSCLGIGRRPSDAERSDSSHLLGDPYQPQYGTLNATGSHNSPRPDPEEIRRQRDALERICAQTNDKLIDVSQATFAEDGSKMTSEYPRLFNERFPPLSPTQSSRPPSAPADGMHSDSGLNPDHSHLIQTVDDENDNEDEAMWLGKIVGNSSDAEGSWVRVVPIESGALTFQFGDPFGGDHRPVR